jgi:hypothetical protein
MRSRGLPGGERDAGALVFAMLLTVVGMMASALIMPTVLAQVRDTRENVARVHELHAAQAGLDVAIGHIRLANDGLGNGVLSLLPCGPFTGSVSAGGTERYSVRVDYFPVDPFGQPDSWVTANRMVCLPGGGTTVTPAFALLRSQGTDTATGAFDSVSTRELRGTYTFETTNQNIVGGLIHAYLTDTSTDLCLDAGSTSPPAGANVQMQLCSEGGDQQKFAYNTNLTLTLVASKTAALPLGMCLDAGTPHAVDAVVRFQQCALTTVPRQQWSINDSSNFEGTTDGVTLDGYCFNVQNPDVVGSFVILGTTSANRCHRGYDNIETFQAEATVGAGAAGGPVGQLVSFAQFGRCLDVTEQNVNKPFIIIWPCKQAPNSALVAWNQKWQLPVVPVGLTMGTGKIITNPKAGPYCLVSPLSTAPGQYVDVQPCPADGSIPLAMTWTVYQDTGVYADSYVIEDAAGYCLGPTNPADKSPDFYPKGQKISKAVVNDCDGSTLQKWNAPPNILDALALKDLSEK